MPVTPYQRYTVRLGGGLNVTDSPEAVGDDEAYELRNFQLQGVGRTTTRLALRSLGVTLGGQIAGIVPFPFGTDVTGGRLAGVAYITKLSPTGVRVTVADSNGQNATVVGTLPSTWGTATTKPKITAASMNQKLFLVDEARDHGLVVYDPSLPSGKLWQPSFSFEGGPALPLRGRVVTQYNNMLFVAGYGTELTADRPEVVRFSYLGLVFDSEGGGDAGTGSSAGMFDIDDYFMVGERGTAVVSMVPASGRLVIATEKAVYTLFGYDRSTFQLDLLDNQRGCVATRAMVEAGGDVYWWSPLGPCRYTGGAVHDIGHKILARLPDISTDSMFAVHAPATYEVRFYYSLTTSADEPDRALVYNYARDAWTEHRYGSDEEPVRFFCGGTVRPVEAEGPGGAVTGFFAPSMSHGIVNLTWTNGDASPGVKTVVEYSEATLLTGTAATTTGSPTITGTGTSFTSALTVGTYIALAGHTNPAYKVTAISSNTSITVSPTPASTASGRSIWKSTGWTNAGEAPSGLNSFSLAYVLNAGTTYLFRAYHSRAGVTTEPSACSATTLSNPAPPVSNSPILAAPLGISIATSMPGNSALFAVSVTPAYSNPFFGIAAEYSLDGSSWNSLYMPHDNGQWSKTYYKSDFFYPWEGQTLYVRARHVDGYANYSPSWLSTSVTF